MSSVCQDQPLMGGEGGGDVILFIAFVSVKLKSEKKEKFYNIFLWAQMTVGIPFAYH